MAGTSSITNPLGAIHLLGYGVDKDISFENELTDAWGIKAHIFDHTIAEVPDSNIVFTEVYNGALFMQSIRVLFPNEKYMEVPDKIYRLVN